MVEKEKGEQRRPKVRFGQLLERKADSPKIKAVIFVNNLNNACIQIDKLRLGLIIKTSLVKDKSRSVSFAKLKIQIESQYNKKAKNFEEFLSY